MSPSSGSPSDNSPTPKSMIKLLDVEDAAVQVAAADWLRKRAAKELVPHKKRWRELLGHDEPRVRCAAAEICLATEESIPLAAATLAGIAGLAETSAVFLDATVREAMAEIHVISPQELDIKVLRLLRRRALEALASLPRESLIPVKGALAALLASGRLKCPREDGLLALIKVLETVGPELGGCEVKLFGAYVQHYSFIAEVSEALLKVLLLTPVDWATLEAHLRRLVDNIPDRQTDSSMTPVYAAEILEVFERREELKGHRASREPLKRDQRAFYIRGPAAVALAARFSELLSLS